jgi:hypothetical protein
MIASFTTRSPSNVQHLKYSTRIQEVLAESEGCCLVGLIETSPDYKISEIIPEN